MSPLKFHLLRLAAWCFIVLCVPVALASVGWEWLAEKARRSYRHLT